MTVADIVRQRQISEILHFTTNRGVTGIVAAGEVKSRKRLPEDKYLERVYLYNCKSRSQDVSWHDYVNLSVTTVNRRLFGISSGSWHASFDGWWCILSFAPEILSHEGVNFTTTNNIYTGVKRSHGPEGLEQLFAPKTLQWGHQLAIRSFETPHNQPTCQQAEVLYPKELSLEYLQRIYFACDAHAAEVESLFDVLKSGPYDCKVAPHLF